MKELYFSAPTSEAFLTVLRPLWSDESIDSYLIGHNELAEELAEVAILQEVFVRRNDVIPSVTSEKMQLLILTEKSGEELSMQLLSCVELENVVIVAPVTEWHFSHKPLFLISIPKSGTHLVYELARALGYHEGVELPEFPVGQTWYCIEYTNSHTVARDFFVDTARRSPFGNRHHSFMHSPALFMYRHPLDILISEAHYYYQDGKTAFAGWFEGIDFDERVIRLLNDNWLIGSLRERVGCFLPWLDFPNVISLSFEELIGAAGGGNNRDQQQLIWSIQLKLQVPGDPQDIASRIFNPDSATFRSGQLGSYKKYLPEHIVRDFVIQNEDILARLGYSTDGSDCLPMDRELRRRRKIRFSGIDYENMPINIESNFLGCNLVRYSKRIYAVPIAAGPVAIEALPDDVLATIPSAPTLNEIKSILLVGNVELSLRRQSLHKLAQAIQGSVTTQNVYQYWKTPGYPTIIEEYNGFNIIFFQNLFFGIRLSFGVVDLSASISSLVQHFASDDFFISHSIDQLRDDIDGFSISKRIHKEVIEVHERTKVMLAELETRLTQCQAQIFQQQVIFDSRINWAVRIAKGFKRIFRGNE